MNTNQSKRVGTARRARSVLALALTCVLAFGALMVPVATSVSIPTLNLDQTLHSGVALNAPMDTQADADALQARLLDVGGLVALSDDKVAGKASVLVTIPAQAEARDLRFVLAESEPFDGGQNAEITLWVKPMAGAQWIEFYAENVKLPGGDKGRWSVGDALTAGRWNPITLDLSEVILPDGLCGALSVKVNAPSKWLFDEVKTLPTTVRAFDLDTMAGGNAVVQDERRQFAPLGDGYDNTPIPLTTGGGFHKVFRTKADFDAGTYEDAKSFEDGRVYFKKQTITQRYSDNASSTGKNALDVAYYQCTLSTPSQPTAVIIKNIGDYSSSWIDTAKFQYYDETTAQWVDVKNITIALNADDQRFELSLNIKAKLWRILAQKNLTANYWSCSLKLIIDQYISPVMNLDNTPFASGRIAWEQEAHATFNFQTRLSGDGGVTWEDWQDVKNGGEIPGLSGLGHADDACLQYRAIYKDQTDAFFEPWIGNVRIDIQPALSSMPLPASERIQKISVDSLLQGKASSDPNDVIKTLTYPALSDDGRVVYEPAAGKVIDMVTGAVRSITALDTSLAAKLNYDGSYALVYVNATSSNNNYASGSTYYNITVVNLKTGEQSRLTSLKLTSWTFMDDNTIVFYVSGQSYLHFYHVAAKTTTSLPVSFPSLPSLQGVPYFYSYKDSASGKYILTGYGSLRPISITMASNGISYNRDGTKLYYSSDSGVVRYDVKSGKGQLLPISFSVSKLLEDGRFWSYENNRYFKIDPETGARQEFFPEYHVLYPNKAGTGALINLGTTSSPEYKYVELVPQRYTPDEPDATQYLLSFDGQRSTYKDGVWKRVASLQAPSSAPTA